MVVPKNRSNSVRKIKYRTQQGDSKTRYRRKEKGKKHVCAISGARLTATHSTRRIAKSKRTPSRIFGGRLSPAVTKKVLKLRSRLEQNLITLEDVPVDLLEYVKKPAKTK